MSDTSVGHNAVVIVEHAVMLDRLKTCMGDVFGRGQSAVKR